MRTDFLQVLILVGANVQSAGDITPKEGDFQSTYRTTQPSIVLRWGIQVSAHNRVNVHAFICEAIKHINHSQFQIRTDKNYVLHRVELGLQCT